MSNRRWWIKAFRIIFWHGLCLANLHLEIFCLPGMSKSRCVNPGCLFCLGLYFRDYHIYHYIFGQFYIGFQPNFAFFHNTFISCNRHRSLPSKLYTRIVSWENPAGSKVSCTSRVVGTCVVIDWGAKGLPAGTVTNLHSQLLLWRFCFATHHNFLWPGLRQSYCSPGHSATPAGELREQIQQAGQVERLADPFWDWKNRSTAWGSKWDPDCSWMCCVTFSCGQACP